MYHESIWMVQMQILSWLYNVDCLVSLAILVQAVQ